MDDLAYRRAGAALPAPPSPVDGSAGQDLLFVAGREIRPELDRGLRRLDQAESQARAGHRRDQPRFVASARRGSPPDRPVRPAGVLPAVGVRHDRMADRGAEASRRACQPHYEQLFGRLQPPHYPGAGRDLCRHAVPRVEERCGVEDERHGRPWRRGDLGVLPRRLAEGRRPALPHLGYRGFPGVAGRGAAQRRGESFFVGLRRVDAQDDRRGDEHDLSRLHGAQHGRHAPRHVDRTGASAQPDQLLQPLPRQRADALDGDGRCRGDDSRNEGQDLPRRRLLRDAHGLDRGRHDDGVAEHARRTFRAVAPPVRQQHVRTVGQGPQFLPRLGLLLLRGHLFVECRPAQVCRFDGPQHRHARQ